MGNADANVYPSELKHTWVTEDQYHGYWLPHISAKFDLFPWFSLRASYTNTLAYPDYYTIVPKLAVSSNSGHFVVWNNYALKPAYSINYDFQVALYNNEIGLFAVTPFLKRIDDLIFSQSSYITDPSKYPGIPDNARTYSLTTFINNPERVDVWGIEAEWQTHFWYLPGILSGLVLNVNYTHIFSEAHYPYTRVETPPPLYLPVYIDTTYQDRLINQPDDILNLSIGFDYSRFSILASMIYQANVYNSTNFFNSLRSDKAKYLRWDLSVKQGLPWFGLDIYLNINNLNSESDAYLIRGSGFPNSEAHYGLTADLGVRWRLE
jgi:outer membrane receptor protein involved in Fe transport